MKSMRERLVNLGFTEVEPQVHEGVRNLIDKEGLTALYEETYLPFVMNQLNPSKYHFTLYHAIMKKNRFEAAYPFWEEVL